MATSCINTPTLTTTDVGTTQSYETTSTLSVTTGDASVSTVTYTTCIASATGREGANASCSSVVSSSLVTYPGGTSTITVPVTITYNVPTTAVTTLWGSSCSVIYTSAFDTTTTPSSSSTSTSIYTPPPTVITSQSVMTSDGSIYTSTVTSTSTPPVVTQTSVVSNNDTGASVKKTNNVGPIVGGVVGGIAALVLLGLLTWKLIKKQSRFDDIFSPNDTQTNRIGHYIKKQPPAGDKPYDYGQLAQSYTNNVGVDPLSQQQGPTNGTFGNDVGPQPSQPSQAPPMHIRNPSLTPLLAGVAAAAASAGAGAAAGSSRPSSSDSSALDPHVTPARQSGHHNTPAPPVSYPPQLQSFVQNSGYGGRNNNGYGGQGQGQGHAGSSSGGYGAPQANLSHTISAGSSSSGPSTYSSNSWGGRPSAGIPGILPVMAGTAGGVAAGRANQQHGQQHQRQRPSYQQYEDPFARTGSPVSIQEQRTLQVTNRAEESYADEGSSSAVGPSTGLTIHTPSPGYDGKGRPVNMLGEKAPIVHLDGGAFQRPDPAATRVPGTPAPPAYSD